MQNSLNIRQRDVVTFDQAAFDEACAALLQLVMQDGMPDAIIGIRTGGLYVADSMAKSVDFSIPVMSLTCRRPSTATKSKFGMVKKIVANLPRPVVDRLRVIEHAMLTKKRGGKRPEGYSFDQTEIAILEDWLRQAGPNPSIIVVDDAVDTGTTLSLVLDAVSQRAPGGLVRSAVITVTTPKPWATPRYTLYSRQLCRFPWSLDA